eukprot:767903-Hanusia_phi.AAC.2
MKEEIEREQMNECSFQPRTTQVLLPLLSCPPADMAAASPVCRQDSREQAQAQILEPRRESRRQGVWT